MLLELVGAAAVLALFLACFTALAAAVRSTQDKLAQQQDALLILDNVLECAAGRPAGAPVSAAMLKAVLDHEIAESATAGARGFSGRCELRNGVIEVSVAGRTGRALAAVRVPVKGESAVGAVP